MTYTYMSWIVKTVTVFALAAYTIWLLFLQNDISSLIGSFHWSFDKLLVIGIVLCMSTINWGMEILKWHIAIKPLTMSLVKSAKSVLTGIALGLITPARVGEYVGRMIYVTNKQRMWSGIATFRCSLAQSSVTYTLGIISFFYLNRTGILIPSIGINADVFLLLSIFLLTVMLLVFVKLDRLLPLIGKLPTYWKQKLRIDQQDSSFDGVTFSTQSQLLILFYATLRYTVYLIQFGFLLLMIGHHYSVLELFSAISLIFLIQSLLPVPALAKVFARTGAAAGVFTLLGYGTKEVITASLVIWVINLLLPALCGLVFLLKLEKEKV